MRFSNRHAALVLLFLLLVVAAIGLVPSLGSRDVYAESTLDSNLFPRAYQVDGTATSTPTGTAPAFLPTATPSPTLTPSGTPEPHLPTLRIASDVAPYYSTVRLPIQFQAGDHPVSSLHFSVDYDQRCLEFRHWDLNNDGIRDGIISNLPAEFTLTVHFDPDDADGELDFFVFATTPPLAALPDRDPLVTIEFTVIYCNYSSPFTTPVTFSTDPAAGFGDPDGNAVTGNTVNGSALVTVIPSPTATNSTRTPCSFVTVDPVISPTTLLTQDLMIRGYAGARLRIDTGFDVFNESIYLGNGLYRVPITLRPNQVHMLTIEWRDGPGCSPLFPSQSPITTDINGNPLIIVQGHPEDTPTPTATFTATPTPTSTPTVMPTPTTTFTPTPTFTSTPTPTLAENKSRITIIKDALISTNHNFRFTGDLGTFRLDDPNRDDGDRYGKEITFLVGAGMYRIAEQQTTKWKLVEINCTPGFRADVDLAQAAVTIDVRTHNDVTCRFVSARTGKLLIQTFEDRNGNGRKGRNEPGERDLAITLYDTIGNLVEQGVTNRLGRFNFNSVPAGDYRVCEELPAGQRNTLPGTIDPELGQPCHTLTLKPNWRVKLFFGNTDAAASRSATAIDPSSGVFMEEMPDLDDDDAGYEEGEENAEESVDEELTMPVEIFLPSISR
ncbi:MAG: hypothetical protein KDE19_22675 [Caldilineaceae bacterium]|nr:hypothetical protein [Caldilineaceae bacterium]